MVLPFESFCPEADLWKTAQDRFKDNFRLQPDKRCTNAKVNAYAKTEMTPLAACNIEMAHYREIILRDSGG